MGHAWERRIFVGKPKRTRPPGRHGCKMLKKFLNKEDGIAWTRMIWFRTGTRDKGNKHSGSIK